LSIIYKNRAILAFFTGFLQILLIGMQVKVLASNHIIGAFFVSICISSLWCFNVNTVIRSVACRVTYVLGAGCGASASIIFYRFLSEIL